jgi:hypothetical protein
MFTFQYLREELAVENKAAGQAALRVRANSAAKNLFEGLAKSTTF